MADVTKKYETHEKKRRVTTQKNLFQQEYSELSFSVNIDRYEFFLVCSGFFVFFVTSASDIVPLDYNNSDDSRVYCNNADYSRVDYNNKELDYNPKIIILI